MSAHGGDIYTAQALLHSKEIIDFSANINPFGVPESVQRAIRDAIPMLQHYPEPNQRTLIAAIAAYHHILPEQIVCGNGGADVLFRAIGTIQPKHALLPVPTFSEYQNALEETGCQVTTWQMPDDFILTDAIFEELQTGKYDFLVLCNPNNPTGVLLPRVFLQRILQLAKQQHIFVLLDECFCDMTSTAEATSMLSEFTQYDNLLILKSLTKRYAIPGLRLGYGICSDTRRVAQIREKGQPWAVNTLAIAAGCAALQDTAVQEQFRQFLQTEATFLYEGLCALGLTVWQPHANFIFFRATQHTDLAERLLAYHILLRHCDNYCGLDATYYRAAVRKREENVFLLQCLKEILQA